MPVCSIVLALLSASPAADAPTTTRDGAIIRGPQQKPQIALVFTGHQFAEGAEVILEQLHHHHAHASFFLTGDFLRNTNFTAVVRRIVEQGHYLGPHSDKHLLYCSWESPPRTLVSRETFRDDLESNLHEIEALGVARERLRYFLPAYEHYNPQVADWTASLGLTLINFTPGTRSNADYTGEGDRNFVSSQVIFDSIMARAPANGLNGFLLLLHLGSGPGRQDKFHHRFGEMLDKLSEKNYQFVRVDELLP